MCGGTLVARASRNSVKLGFLLLLFSIAHLPLLRHADAKIVQGNLITSNNWAFLARFCFLTKDGIFRYSFQLGGEERNLKLLLYYDGAYQWPAVYPSNKTCQEKESVLSIDDGQIIPLNTLTRITYASGCVEDDNGIVRCENRRRFISSRPRWWYIVLADCSSTKGLNVTYNISLTNALPGTFWKEHFSADEFYILPLLIPTACLYTIFIVLSLYIALQLRSRRLLHISYKLFIASLMCQLLGVSCELYSYINLGLTGASALNAYLLGQLSEACSETLYTVLMLLLALGYTITKSVLTASQIRWLILFVSSTALCQIKLHAKLHFYGSLLFLGSVWFLFHPLTILINTIFVDDWVRESVAKGSSLFIVFLGHIMFLYVTRPSVNNKRFPFHIRTFQVVPIGGYGQDHSYEPTLRAATAFTITRSPAYVNRPRSVE
ncbi:hypothetical protein ALC60_12333 [Trachymyrmex zeteki]|uniref:Intimal thickness related receptor IRP domain-containing protein n=1 Tax=Mycetomoellerius zeteki TaxID=64791 RepID=A0A151WL79_9HYME|nr:hypothetical protein ALC60_12333 [Trachymyrmex zeteki]